MNWTLIARSDALQQARIEIDREMVIGRNQQADIIVQAAHVSRRHALLQPKEDGSLWIQDLGSSNGTLVNGQVIAAAQQLHHGDRIGLQDLIFEVECETAQSAIHTTQGSVTETMVFRATDSKAEFVVDRQSQAELDHTGMPKHIDVPKPAPLPSDVSASTDSIAKPIQDHTHREQAPQSSLPKQTSSNEPKTGLMGIVAVVIAIILAALYYFMGK